MNNKKNQIIIIITLIIAAFVVFVYFKNSSTDNSGSSIVAEKRVAEFAGAREILSLLNRMSVVKLDDSIFNDKSFISLQDTTVVLVSQPVGRNNPFAPLGSDGVRATTTSPQIQNTSNQGAPFGSGR